METEEVQMEGGHSQLLGTWHLQSRPGRRSVGLYTEIRTQCSSLGYAKVVVISRSLTQAYLATTISLGLSVTQAYLLTVISLDLSVTQAYLPTVISLDLSVTQAYLPTVISLDLSVTQA
ncbi:unnamed protein product [Boreogadus saida]